MQATTMSLMADQLALWHQKNVQKERIMSARGVAFSLPISFLI
jgi:hypothetical protein